MVQRLGLELELALEQGRFFALQSLTVWPKSKGARISHAVRTLLPSMEEMAAPVASKLEKYELEYWERRLHEVNRIYLGTWMEGTRLTPYLI